jgi:RecB family exonuclease
LSRSQLLSLLVDVATHETLPRPSDDVGRVRVLSAATARSVEVKHLVLAGMSEQAFPSPERQGRLYSESDYRALANIADQDRAAAELPAVSRSQEEMLLFYEMLTRAEERLTISYPALDERAQALPPSPYVEELMRIIGPTHLQRPKMPSPSPIPSAPTPCSSSDWRLAAIHRALDGNNSLLAGLFSTPAMTEVAGSLDAALQVIAARGSRDRFGPAEGLLTSDAVRAKLAQRFGPQHLWSPSQWERYARCPYHYFMEDVLGLEPLAEIALATDHRRRGTLLHRALAEFHRQVKSLLAEGGRRSARDITAFQDEFGRVLESLVASTPRAGVDAALVEIDRRQIDAWGREYFVQHGKYDATWSEIDEPPAPAHFEFRFGPPTQDDADGDDSHSTSLPFVLDLGGEQIRVTGRIDRIDVGRDGGRLVFNVIDYKSGLRPTLTTERIESGERLQPALYVMAAQAMLFRDEPATPLWAGYWSMKNGVTTDGRFSLRCSSGDDQSSEQWIDLQAKVRERVGQFVSDIRHGDFPVASRDDHCTSICPFSTVCRVAQVRGLGKEWFTEDVVEARS